MHSQCFFRNFRCLILYPKTSTFSKKTRFWYPKNSAPGAKVLRVVEKCYNLFKIGQKYWSQKVLLRMVKFSEKINNKNWAQTLLFKVYPTQICLPKAYPAAHASSELSRAYYLIALKGTSGYVCDLRREARTLQRQGTKSNRFCP